MMAKVGGGGSLCIENQATSLPQVTNFTTHLYGHLNLECEEFNV